MFTNFSNHDSEKWSDEQYDAASYYGMVEDIAFPQVPANATTEEVKALADKYVDVIMVSSPDVVMCQGEFSLSYYVTEKLKALGVKVVVACSDRKVVETVNKNGETVKTAVFKFKQFREI